MLPSSAAALRNRGPIAEVLRSVLPKQGLVLEIASGTGEHVEYFAGLFPDLQWQPTDIDVAALHWVAARKQAVGLPNILEPIMLDVTDDIWLLDYADAVLCSNMVHISPWEATLGLLDGAGRILPDGAAMILYGPYRRADVPTAPSNEDFDRSLRARDPSWGLRTLEQVRAAADRRGLSFERLVEMPANNLSLIFRRA
jgi:hypothetical protein